MSRPNDLMLALLKRLLARGTDELDHSMSRNVSRVFREVQVEGDFAADLCEILDGRHTYRMDHWLGEYHNPLYGHARGHSREHFARVGEYLRALPDALRAAIPFRTHPRRENFSSWGPKSERELAWWLPLAWPDVELVYRLTRLGWHLHRRISLRKRHEVWLATHAADFDRQPRCLLVGRLRETGKPSHARVLDKYLAPARGVSANGLVPLRGWVLQDDLLCLVYDVVVGTPLNRALWPLSIPRPLLTGNKSARFVQRLAQALAPGHRAQIPVAHGNLMPANIFLTEDAEGELIPRVLGLAAHGLEPARVPREPILGEHAERTRLWADQGLCAWLYAAPETAGEPDPHPAHDVYALGLIWLSVLTGIPVQSLEDRRPSWVQKVAAKHLAPDLQLVLWSCLEGRGPRIPDAGALDEALAVCLDAPLSERGRTELVAVPKFKLRDFTPIERDPVPDPEPYSMQAQPSAQEIPGLVRAILDSVEAHLPDRAIPTATRALELDPNSRTAFALRARALLKARRYAEAVADYTEALRLSPSDWALALGRGQAHYELKQFEAAVADFSEVLRLCPGITSTLKERGDAFHELKRLDEALRDYTEAIRIVPDFWQARYHRGVTLRSRKQYREAIHDFTEALRIYPTWAWIPLERAVCYRLVGEFRRAIEDCKLALSLDASLWYAYYNRGESLRELKEYDLALIDLGESLRLNPNDPWGFASRGETLRALGKLKEALADCNHALELRPGLAWAQGIRGATLRGLGRFDEAIADLRNALRQEPSYSWVDYHLQRALVRNKA